MATFILRANELSGQTGLTVRLYEQGQATIVNAGGDTLTETAISDGQFTATITETLSGVYEYFVYKSGSPIYRGIVNADGSVLIADTPTITPSDPGKRTGYLVCYDEDGELEAGVVVTVTCFFAPSTGLALDSQPRSETSGVDGVVEFPNMVVGAKYRVRRGLSGEYKITVPTGSGAFELDSIVGRETA